MSEFLAEKIVSIPTMDFRWKSLKSSLTKHVKGNVQIHLYFGLKEEAMTISNPHTGSQTSLKPTFQDNVYQALKMKDSPDVSANIAQMLGEIEMKEISKESVGTVVSVARYGEENIKLFHLLVKKVPTKE